MSLQASIDIYFNKLSFYDTIIKLSDNWIVNDYGNIVYMDNDDSEWKIEPLDKLNIILESLQNRYSKGNSVGITLVTKENSGGMFLFYPNENLLSIIININRKKIINTHFSDYSYYTQHLNNILSEVIKISYMDT